MAILTVRIVAEVAAEMGLPHALYLFGIPQLKERLIIDVAYRLGLPHVTAWEEIPFVIDGGRTLPELITRMPATIMMNPFLQSAFRYDDFILFDTNFIDPFMHRPETQTEGLQTQIDSLGWSAHPSAFHPQIQK